MSAAIRSSSAESGMHDREERRFPRIAAGLSELSQMVGVDQKTLRKWAREHGMPTYRVGGRVLVLVSDFQEWLRKHRDQPEMDGDAAVDATLARLRGDAA